METIKEQSVTPAVAPSSKLRFPLRSATKGKDGKSASAAAPVEVTPFPSSRRSRLLPDVSRSLVELSGDKDKSTNPTRRISIPAKSTSSPLPRPGRSVTPPSLASVKKSANGPGKIDTPKSSASKSANKKKYSILESASYWIAQIKISESACNHLISIGFFKLALEVGCEPIQLMRDKLKLYARKHKLLELGETAKDLLRSYNILEELEQSEASETCSQGLESSDRDSQASSTSESRCLKPKSFSAHNITKCAVKKESDQKRSSIMKTRASITRNSANSITESKISLPKKLQKPTGGRQEPSKEKDVVRKLDKAEAAAVGREDPSFSPADEIEEEGKENIVHSESDPGAATMVQEIIP